MNEQYWIPTREPDIHPHPLHQMKGQSLRNLSFALWYQQKILKFVGEIKYNRSKTKSKVRVLKVVLPLMFVHHLKARIVYISHFCLPNVYICLLCVYICLLGKLFFY